jgi:lipoate-protein ligase A
MKLLDLTCPTPAENLACDEALLDDAEIGNVGEVLRFWEAWEHFVVVGYSNKIATEVNVAACEAKTIPIYRRCSGGGTVLQGPGCLNYSLLLKISNDGPLRTIGAANKFIMERNRAAIEQVGRVQRTARPTISKIEVCGHTDLTIDGRKFSGNSQRRRKHFLLFHGTFLLNFNLALISEFLPLPSKQPCYRESRSHSDFLVNLGVDAKSVKTALAQAWNATETTEEVATKLVSKLVAEKYGNCEWNLKNL